VRGGTYFLCRRVQTGNIADRWTWTWLIRIRESKNGRSWWRTSTSLYPTPRKTAWQPLEQVFRLTEEI
jgi:hypothetical protein